jgi:alkylhydroperoxidase family enzyme
MARLTYLERDQLSAAAREVLDDLERQRGFVPNLYAAMAHSPRLLKQFLAMTAVMRADGALPGAWRELTVLRVAALTGSETMRISHLASARASGIPAPALATMGDTNPAGLSSQDQAIVAFVDEITNAGAASSQAWGTVAAFLTEEQLVELTLLAGFYNMVARFLRSAAIDLDPRYAGS